MKIIANKITSNEMPTFWGMLLAFAIIGVVGMLLYAASDVIKQKGVETRVFNECLLTGITEVKGVLIKCEVLKP